MRSILGLIIGAVAGGLVGYSGLLCPGGACPLTGSWWGGAVFGGLLGFFLAGGCPACASSSYRVEKPPGQEPSADGDHLPH